MAVVTEQTVGGWIAYDETGRVAGGDSAEDALAKLKAMLADKEAVAAPPVGSDIFSGPAALTGTPPPVGSELFAPPRVTDPNSGKPVDRPVGDEIFTDKQREGLL